MATAATERLMILRTRIAKESQRRDIAGWHDIVVMALKETEWKFGAAEAARIIREFDLEGVV
jgi:hypothetical protein